ncbi:hypothetical protein [Chloroflexus sp.]|uniref:hypothetical protein n=1 Tax=Chloroflexus sp. TaxID=1904827 RepID=UPI00298F1A69|nr:hypothetical protein [Chloroflexus sp.]MDW8405354.1 hypothetical protein [Chloroflexus sp.]
MSETVSPPSSQPSATPPANPNQERQPSAPATNATRPLRQRPARNNRLRVGMAVLLIVLLLTLLALVIAGIGAVRFPWVSQSRVAPRDLILQAPTVEQVAGSQLPTSALKIDVAPRFAAAYEQLGGLRRLGLPISPALLQNGREVQWFERARLEYWPELSGTPYEFQIGLVGVEYVAGRTFLRPEPFASRPDLRYFPETGFGVGGLFLQYWEEHGGLTSFGYPISAEFDEVQPDGRAFRVQYFERARFELHPEAAGTPYVVQLGLLGSALYFGESRPQTVQPRPTPVP